MPSLRLHDDAGEGRCAECGVRPSVGPCAACHSMICGDCCSLVSEQGANRVICMSCTRMVADVNRRPVRRRSTASRTTAYMILVVLALGILATLSRL